MCKIKRIKANDKNLERKTTMTEPKSMTMLLVAKEDLLQVAEEIVKMTIEKTKKGQEDVLVTCTQASHLLGVTTATLWRWAKTGYLVPVKIGSKTMYHLYDIERIKNVRV